MRPLDSQTFVKFIFNEGNKMINVFGMKISLRKVRSVCVHLKEGKKRRRGESRNEKITQGDVNSFTFVC